MARFEMVKMIHFTDILEYVNDEYGTYIANIVHSFLNLNGSEVVVEHVEDWENFSTCIWKEYQEDLLHGCAWIQEEIDEAKGRIAYYHAINYLSGSLEGEEVWICW